MLSKRNLQVALARDMTVKLIREVEWFCDDVSRLAVVESGVADVGGTTSGRTS